MDGKKNDASGEDNEISKTKKQQRHDAHLKLEKILEEKKLALELSYIDGWTEPLNK